MLDQVKEKRSLEILYDVALQWYGKPYQWGGESYFTGVDCSGLVQELLRSIGLDPKGDQTAQGLYEHFAGSNCIVNYPKLGALSFYGKNVKNITHVAFCLNSFLCIESGGGGSSTLTEKDAIEQNALVRVRPIRSRNDLVGLVMPNY